jgi:hypothetical protein
MKTTLSGFDNVDQPNHKLGELVQRWNNRLHRENLSFAEDYIGGRMVIAFVVRVGERPGGRRLATGQNVNSAGGEPFSLIFVCNALDADFRDGDGCDQSPVFVGPIQVIQGDEKISGIARAYIVGDDWRELGGESLYLSIARLQYQRLPVLIYRKTGFLRVSFGGNKDSCRDVIQGASEIVDGVSDHGGEVAGRVFCLGANHSDGVAAVLSRLEIFAYRDTIFVKTLVDSEPLLNIEDVLVGLFDL